MSETGSLESALIRADLWRVLALAFASPTEERLTDLRAVCGELASALSSHDHPLHEGISDLAETLESLDPAALQHEHNALFSLDVLVPAYEGSYQRIERGAVVGDVAGFYKAFDLKPESSSGPPDSLWNELAFLCWLSLKEAYAIENEMAEGLEIIRNAMAEFLKDHLGRWTGAFVDRLLTASNNSLYVTASHLLLATVTLTADELGVAEIHALDVQTTQGDSDAVTCPVACST